MPAEYTRRSTIAATLEQRGTTVFDLDKGELFDLVSKNDDALTRADFDKLYSVISEQAKKESELKDKAARDAVQSSKRAKLLGFVAIVVTLFLGLSVAANFLSVLVVVDSQIKTTAEEGALTAKDGSGAIMQTALAHESVPLYVAPVLPEETLFAITSISVTYEDDDGSAVQAQLSVGEVRKHNSTYVELSTMLPGRVLKIINGDAAIVQMPTASNGLLNSVVYPVCAANVTCSSFKVHALDKAQLVAAADAELAKVGVSESRRRQLKALPTLQMCDFGSGGGGPIIPATCNNWDIFTQGGAGGGNAPSNSGTFKNFKVKWCTTYPLSSDLLFWMHGYKGNGGAYLGIFGSNDFDSYPYFIMVTASSSYIAVNGPGSGTKWAWQDWLGDAYAGYTVANAGVDQVTDFLTHMSTTSNSYANKYYPGSSKIFSIGHSDGGQLSIMLNLLGIAKAAESTGGIPGAAADVINNNSMDWIDDEFGPGEAFNSAVPDFGAWFADGDGCYSTEPAETLAAALGIPQVTYPAALHRRELFAAVAGGQTTTTTHFVDGHSFSRLLWSSGSSRIAVFLNPSSLDDNQALVHSSCPNGGWCAHANVGPANDVGDYYIKWAKNRLGFLSFRHGLGALPTNAAVPIGSPAPPIPTVPLITTKGKMSEPSFEKVQKTIKRKTMVKEIQFLRTPIAKKSRFSFRKSSRSMIRF